MTHEAGDALGVLERDAQQRVRAHRRAGEHRAVDAAVVEHADEVVGEVGVLVGRPATARASDAPWPRAS